jgi:hypothetical protein
LTEGPLQDVAPEAKVALELPIAPMTLDQLQAFVRAEGVDYAVVSSVDGSTWLTAGDEALLPYRGLVQAYFPGPESMRSLSSHLEGQILPTLVGQGELLLVVCKPAATVIAGFFVRTDSDLLSRIDWAEKVNADFSRLIEASGG